MPTDHRPRSAPDCPSCLRLLSCLGLLGLLAGPAHGGGFEFPANGTEALGRGGAFTAKADSPLALEYNVAGLSGQRGTRVLFDSNLHFSSYSLERPGLPVAADVSHQPFYAPWFAASTDFGYFNRWTFAIGAFGPSSVGRRSYPVGDDGKGAARYDVTSTDLLTLFPTLAVGVRPSRYFDIGMGLQLAYGTFKLSSASRSEDNRCRDMAGKPDLSTAVCDSTTLIDVKSSLSALISLAFLVHPSEHVDVGFHVRSGANLGGKKIEAKGTLTAILGGEEVGSEDATFTTDLPWIFRFGARYAFRKGGREVGDVELDATYEAWSLSEGEGSRLTTERHPLGGNLAPLDVFLPHYYRDSYSLRLGGALNQPAGPALLTVRLGAFYDSSVTDPADTRLDFNTLGKLGATVGLGARQRGVSVNIAYGFLHSLERTVTDGRLFPVNSITGRPLVDNMGNPIAAVNNGTYRGQNHIVSLGIQILFEELVRGDRWQRGRGAPGTPTPVPAAAMPDVPPQ